LSGRGLCDELITRPEESYRLCCVVVCDLETSRMGAPYIYDISRLRVKRGLLSAEVWFPYNISPKGICVNKVALDRLFSEYFGSYRFAPCQQTYIVR